MKKPELGKHFIVSLLCFSLFWYVCGMSYTYFQGFSLIPFSEIFFLTFMDLAFLILIFWNLFYSNVNIGIKRLQFLFFLFFKLVCLAFLAIILKRLKDAPFSSIALGIAFMGFGPLIAGVLSNSFSKNSTKE